MIRRAAKVPLAMRNRAAAFWKGERPDGDVALADDAVRRFRVVACRACAGVLKPDVVFFGEHVPTERFHRALALLEASSSLLVLGSSLSVGSGLRFVTAARRRGLPVAIVTRGATRADRHADVRVDAPLRTVLPGLVHAVTGGGRTTDGDVVAPAPRQ